MHVSAVNQVFLVTYICLCFLGNILNLDTQTHS